jgi:endonuclease YncB( thermonuclease family)
MFSKFCSCFRKNNNIVLEKKLSEIKYDDVPIFSLNGLKTIGKIVDIYDGDTCKIVLIHENTFKKFSCRLLGIDTPEMKPPLTKNDRDIEIINAHKCRNRLIQLVTSCDCSVDKIYKKSEIKNLLENNKKIINVHCFDFDKYGRLLVNLYIENDTISVNDILIREKYAKPYDGGKKDIFVY